MPKIKVGIVGVGMVGGALKAYFDSKENFEVFCYDKGKDIGSMKEVNNADYIYLTVPTPIAADGKSCDTSIVESIVDQLEGEKIIIIKSTIIPGTTDKLQRLYPNHKILFNPEFLTEVTADQDMNYPDKQIVGYTKKSYDVAMDVLLQLPSAPYERFLPATFAEFIKYKINSWFGTKVSKNNEDYDIFKAMGGKDEHWELIIEAVSADKRIGRSHLQVHHKGARGYGGKCLPKDIRAFMAFAKSIGVDTPIMDAAEAYNNKLLNKQGLKFKE